MNFNVLTKAILVLLLAVAPLFAQDAIAPSLSGDTAAASPAPEIRPDGGLVRLIRRVTQDGSLSQADFDAALQDTGQRVSEREMIVLRDALQGKVRGGADFALQDGVLEHAKQAIFFANMYDESKALLAGGKTFGGTPIPQAVRDVVVTAKLNGAILYSPNDRNSDGETKYSHYPSITPPTQNMAFDWTEVTPMSLEADMNDTGTHLRKSGQQGSMALFEETTGGTGSISSEYDELGYPVTTWSLFSHPQRDLLIEHGPEEVQRSRGPSGNRWSSNVAIMSDGTIHCLPANRRHSDHPNLILTNPALARGQQLMWNGHIRVNKGVVTYIGTSGMLAKRAGRGQDIFLNPVPLLKAWGFKVSDGLSLRSEHSSERPAVSEELAIQFQDPAKAQD